MYTFYCFFGLNTVQRHPPWRPRSLQCRWSPWWPPCPWCWRFQLKNKLILHRIENYFIGSFWTFLGRVWTSFNEIWTPTNQENDKKQKGTGFYEKRNAVQVVGVFGLYLRPKNAKTMHQFIKYNRICLFSPIKWYITYPIEVCNGGYRNLETSILELTSYVYTRPPSMHAHPDYIQKKEYNCTRSPYNSVLLHCHMHVCPYNWENVSNQVIPLYLWLQALIKHQICLI